MSNENNHKNRHKISSSHCLNSINIFPKKNNKHTITLNESQIKKFNIIQNTDYFDADYYNKKYLLNFKTNSESLLHYLEYGFKQGFNPSSRFDGNIYLKKYPDVKAAGMNPLVHYLEYGIRENRTDKCDNNVKAYNLVRNSNLYDHEYYKKQSGITTDSPRNGLLHYLEYGFKQGFNPSSRFDGNIYLKKYPDVKAAGVNPLVHYLKHGIGENRTDKCDNNVKAYNLVRNSNLYDHEYYKKQSGITTDSPRNGLLHYLEYGFKQGFNPSSKFNGNIYLKKYYDVKIAGVNPLVHYLKHGIRENRTDKCDNNVKAYNLVRNSNLYDHEYYKKQSGRNARSPRNGLLHYLEHGFKQGFNPSSRFDGNIYLKKYPDVKAAGMNPLVHYLKHGIKENRLGIITRDYTNFKEYGQVNEILNQLNKRITIIIFMSDIINSKKCVGNILGTTENFEIVIMDTTKNDEIKNIFDIPIIKNMQDLNDIFKENDNDIIFLKDNVKTFPDWATNLKIAAYSNENIGFVSPISNYSPVNLIEESLINEDTYKIIKNISLKDYSESPLPNDSCVYVKHDVLGNYIINDKNGNWFENLYETSKLKGWTSTLDDSTFVYYYKNSNIKSQKDNFKLLNPFVFDNKIEPEFLNSKAFEKVYSNIKENINISNAKKHILFSLHYSGGVEFTTKDIIKSISDEYDCYILKSYKNKLTLTHYVDNNFIVIKEFNLRYQWYPKLITSIEYIQIYFHILINYNIDLVHIDHCLFHTFDLVDICNSLRIPIVLALHDFYYICPTIFLLDENKKPCGGYCGDKIRNCTVVSDFFDLPINVSNWKNEWKTYVADLFKKVSVIITATEFTRDLYLEHYKMLSEENIKIIEHGRDLIKYTNFNSTPDPQQPIKILIPGTINVHKGSEFIRELYEFDKENDNKLELHFMGTIYEDLENLGINHGRYLRENFAKNISKIRPSFIGIFSICPETYSHTLTESLSVGIPVLASNLGALKFRIERDGGGWLVDINNPKKTYEQILNIANNKNEYLTVKNEVDNIKTITTHEMGENYKKLYKMLFDNGFAH